MKIDLSNLPIPLPSHPNLARRVGKLPVPKAPYTGFMSHLAAQRNRLEDLGWNTNFTIGKGIWHDLRLAYDGISISFDPHLVVVDIDSSRWDLPPFCILPPTLKEKSPRGIHLFYHSEGPLYTQIKEYEGIDFLGSRAPQADNKQKYDDASEWGFHVLCSPTPGYKLMWPDQFPARMDIAPAPDWLVRAMSFPQGEER